MIRKFSVLYVGQIDLEAVPAELPADDDGNHAASSRAVHNSSKVGLWKALHRLGGPIDGQSDDHNDN